MSQTEIVLIKLGLSSISSAIAETATFPLDLTKTRLQIQGEVATKTILQKKGMLETAKGIIRREGLTKLWSGLHPAVFRQVIYTGVRMPSYEFFRENLFKRNLDGSFSVWKAILCGCCAGSVGQFIATPMDLAKVKMQTRYQQTSVKCNYSNRSLLKFFIAIYQTRGIRGLWAGCIPSIHRAALVNIGNLATYDIAKQKILKNTKLKDNWQCHMVSSICSGFVASSLSTPADVIKTRIMNQARSSDGRGLYYTSSCDCLIKTIKQEGIFSLYKGFIPIWSRIAPWSMIFWLTNEQLRKLIGFKTF